MYKKLLFLGVLALIVFVGWFVYEIVSDEPPQFFPLDDVRAEYRVTRQCPQGQGWVEQTKVSGTAYCLEYRGDNVLMKEDNNNSNFFSITVGKTNVDLARYLDKKVTHIVGRFTTADTQCIQNRCVAIGGPFVVLDIKTLELAE